MKKLLLALALAGLLTACGRNETTTTESALAPPATEAGAPTAAATAPPTEAELKQAAQATQESSGNSQETPADASLARLTATPENVQLPSGRWKAGTHYTPIVPAQGTSAEPGQVEVLEILWLGCPHCYDLNPYVEAWKKKKAEYVKFTQEHVMWGPVHRAHGKLFYTLETLGRGDLVPKAFEEIHRRGNNLVAASDPATQQLHLAFAIANGISEADFKREYNGFGVNTRLQRAEELTRRYRIETVPQIIVNGKYRADITSAGGPDQLFQLVNDLAAAEKSR